MKILLVDTCYPQFLESFYFNPALSYESQLQMVLDQSFGTSDFYSRNLRQLGWEAFDVIANCDDLQMRWAFEAAVDPSNILEKQIAAIAPDVVFLQDLSVKLQTKPQFLAAQCSCPWPGDDAIRRCDLVCTSFPHYLPRIERLGVKAVYNPLAFDPIVLDRINDSSDGVCSCGNSGRNGHECSECGHLYSLPSDYLERCHDCVFVGGVGNPSHWRNGMETLEAVAQAIPTFKCWGYGLETLPKDSALRDKYCGEAWGLDMYRIMLQSKIVLNRHGEVAQGHTNNMRCFETTGCGAMLLTERSINLHELFGPDEAIPYGSPDEAVQKIKAWLEHDEGRARIATNGQRRTLKDHTYAQRMKAISDVLTGMLCPG